MTATIVAAGVVAFAGRASAQEAPAAPATSAAASDPPPVAPAASPASPGSPESPAGYNVPLAQPGAPADDHAVIDNSPVAHDGHPLAGYHNGLFYLRDHHDNFHLYVQGRMQLDFYSFLGGGAQEVSGLRPTLFVRRIRPEVTGEFLGHWRFMIAGDFGATAIDNPDGRSTETVAAAPGTAPSATSGKYAGPQTTRFQAAATDAFINYRESSIFNVMVGQMDAPFTMENRTSDKYFPFMERSMAVRAVGIPTNKEIGGMFWGETKDRFVYYSVGPYMGDGQNKPNVDNRFDVMGRAMVHPLANTDVKGALKDMHLGGSFRYGSRDKSWVNYDYPSMSTQGQFAFWKPTYAGSGGTTHIIPAGDQIGFAGELRVPFEQFDLTGELVYIHNGTREAVEGYQAANTERFGAMKGIAYYATLGWWVFGKRDINGLPGYGNPPRLDWTKSDPVKADQALQVLAKFEQVNLNYSGNSRSGTADAKNVDGDIKVNAFELGVNYWATKHVRLSLNYVYDMFPDSAPTSATAAGGPFQTSVQRAVAPGNTLGKGIDDGARDGAHDLHEFLARFAIAL